MGLTVVKYHSNERGDVNWVSGERGALTFTSRALLVVPTGVFLFSLYTRIH